MRFLSVCSGIEAATVAWRPLGWEAVAFSEIDPFPCAVLAHYYPDTPNQGDMTLYKEWDLGGRSVDLLVGGTPCQSFSVAGLRKGMADPRGNLALVYLGVADHFRPRWIVWENVPGVLSSSEGRDFGSFLGGLGQLGYGWAYRVIDSEYCGVAQRRRRPFVVGHLGDWRRAAAVLFERESLRWDTAPRREEGESVAPTIGARTTAGGGLGTDAEVGGALVVARPLLARHSCSQREDSDIYIPVDITNARIGGRVAGTIQAAQSGGNRGHGVMAFNARMDPTPSPTPGALDEDGYSQAVAFHENQRAEITVSETAGSLKMGGGKPGQGYPAVSVGMAVRRLTPRECERLQGFPDDYTLIPYRGKLAKDSPRYRAIGNSMPVPVIQWIGQRIALLEGARLPGTGTGWDNVLGVDGKSGREEPTT